MTRMVLLVLGLIATQAMAAVAPAYGQTMIWKFRSDHPNIVDVQLYASSRNNVWPGSGRVWSLNDDNVKQMTISCVAGEKVCYGAWVRGTESSYWGGGRNNRQRCDNCCYICTNMETPVIRLVFSGRRDSPPQSQPRPQPQPQPQPPPQRQPPEAGPAKPPPSGDACKLYPNLC